MDGRRTLFGQETCKDLPRLIDSYHQGQVHSVFEGTVNILIGNRLITVLSSERSLVPYGIRLSSPFVFQNFFSQGERVSLSNAQILFTNTTVDYKKANAIDLNLISFQNSGTRGQVSLYMKGIIEVLEKHPYGGMGISPMLSQLFPECGLHLPQNQWSIFLTPRFHKCYHFLKNNPFFDNDELKKLGSKLGGGGPGLTPSSDDFLLGLMGVLIAENNDEKTVYHLGTGAVSSTNTISGEMLFHGSMGRFSKEICEFFYKRNHKDDIVNITQDLQALGDYGSTSGADLLAGLYFGYHLLFR